jgi:AcrR family transcriptional regulator
VARWEPDPRGRLLDAALALFGEQGYDRTTAAQIAERAGLTKATLFRLFADKREILFQGQAATVDTVRRVVGDAPDDLDGAALVEAVLDALVAEHVPEQQAVGAAIAELTASSEALRERAVHKHFVITEALEHALRSRLQDDARAAVLAWTAVRAYYDGFDRWTVAAPGADLRPLVAEELARLRAAAADPAVRTG